jgi:guanylate kinase
MDHKEDSEFFFTSCEVFENMIAREEFLEYVRVLGNYYGTPNRCLQQARENGKDLLIQVDDRGTAQIKQKVADAVSILILPGRSARRKRKFASSETNLMLPSFVREVFIPSLHQGVPFPSQEPRRDRYNHVIVSDRVEDSARRLAAIIRSERLRRP